MFDSSERYDKIQKEQEKEHRELLVGTKNYIKAVMKKNKYSEFLLKYVNSELKR